MRYHHFDLARELHKLGHLERIFTSLPWWKVSKESREQNIPKNLISCNFYMQGIRRVGGKLPFYNKSIDGKLAVLETGIYSKWVARKLPECDAYIGISGSGLHAGKLAKSRGSIYVMDRGSTQIRHADIILREEYKKWGLKWAPINPWLIENEEAEADAASIITVPSHFVKGTFVSQGTDSQKIRVVPYGVSLSEFYPIFELKPDHRSFKILFVGQFSIRKGIPYLLEAFDKFQHPNKELIVVGSIAPEVKDIFHKYAGLNIRFVGQVPRNEVKDYMSSAHVLVLPSLEEGLALVQAQAMACGCPVIATPNTGSETLFQNREEGLIVEAQNVQALVESFHLLSEDRELLSRMSEASIKKVVSLGGWKTYTEQILKAITTV
jgi:glycosyltransferase involved in cell wall biosynthesis